MVEPLGRVSRARGTVRVTGEKGESVREKTEGNPPGSQIRHNSTAAMPRLSLLGVANHAMGVASDELKRAKLAIKKLRRKKL